MILNTFPGSTKNDDVMQCFGAQNVIVAARAHEVAFSSHTAPLSIKASLRGCETYVLDGQPYVVDENCYMVINDDQPYASYINSETETESFCVFFRKTMAEEAFSALTAATETLLEGQRASSVLFLNHLHPHDQIVSPLLQRIHAALEADTASSLWLEEQFHHLMGGLLALQDEVLHRMQQLPALRTSTRLELYCRLHRAKDYLESCYAEPVTIAALAKVACLSEYHFLRQFKLAFHCTPHQYLTRVRLQKAMQLLRSTKVSVTEAFLSVGFENASSFARLFKRHFGMTPQQASQLGRIQISSFGKAPMPSSMP